MTSMMVFVDDSKWCSADHGIDGTHNYSVYPVSNTELKNKIFIKFVSAYW